jgi:integrase
MAKPQNPLKHITQRGQTYRVSMQPKVGKRLTATCQTLEEAVQVRDEMVAGTWTNRHADGAHKTQTLGEAWSDYLDYRFAKSAKADPRRFRWYEKTILGFFGPSTSLDDLTAVRMSDFYDELTINRQYSATVVNYMGTLLQMCQKRAYNRGRRATEPTRMEYRKHTTGRIRFLSDTEEQQCLNWFERTGRDEFADLFMFYVDTGFRKSEAFNLKWEDIDLSTGRITVWVSKTDQPRTVKMTGRVKSILRKLHLSHSAAQRTIFGHLSERRFYRVFIEMRNAIGVGDDRQFVVHMLRHTCCTRLLGAGVDIRSVMQWMGHSSLEMTQRYAHFIPSSLDNAADALDNRNTRPVPQDQRVISIR